MYTTATTHAPYSTQLLATAPSPSSVNQEDPYTQAKHRTVPACFKEQTVRDGFRKEVEKLKHQAVGSFSDRISPDLRGINVNPKLMLCVDALIETEYGLTNMSMWSLNCLVYAGAVTVERVVRHSLNTHPKKKKDCAGIIERCSKHIYESRRTISRIKNEIKRRRCRE